MNRQRPEDFLSAEKLQLFLAGLSGLSAEEVRKAKVLYLKNAISEYEAAVASLSGLGCFMVPFMVIPLFWPFLYMQRKAIAAGKRLMRERIENAMEVWREDLAGEHFDLPPEF